MVRPQPAAAALRLRPMTQRELARRIHYSETWVSLTLRGHRRPSAEFRRAVAAALGLPESQLFDGPERGAA